MTWYWVALIALGAALVGASTVFLVVGIRARRETRAIVVRMRSGRRFRGAWQRNRNSPWLIIYRAELVQDGQPAMPLDGFVCMPKEQIEYFQVVPDHRSAEPWVTTPNGERRAG